MKLAKLVLAASVASLALSSVAMAADSFSAAQKKQLQQLVHDYIVSNPEILVEASQALQQKQQQSMQSQAKAAITQNADALFTDKIAMVGNAKGNVTLVEFFDYQCIHCKKMSPVVANLIKSNPNLRVVYKEFPIFGQSSEYASQVALAAGLQGKYEPMHNALLKVEKNLDEKTVMTIAQSLNLNVDQLKKDITSPQVTEILAANRALGEKMHLMGTPAFIVAATPNGQLKKDSDPTFIPGAASEEALNGLIKKASN